MIAAGVVFLLEVAMSPVQVVDDGCPSGAEVELALASMLTFWGATPASRDVAKLARRADQLRATRNARSPWGRTRPAGGGGRPAWSSPGAGPATPS